MAIPAKHGRRVPWPSGPSEHRDRGAKVRSRISGESEPPVRRASESPSVRVFPSTVTSIPLSELEACIRTGCHSCTDFTALDADISAGSVGNPQGMTTLLIRNTTGKAFVDAAVRAQKLLVKEGADIPAIEKLAKAKIKKNRRK